MSDCDCRSKRGDHTDTSFHSQGGTMSRRNSRKLRLTSHAVQCAIETLEDRGYLSYGSRGTLSVIVASGVAAQLTSELAQYKQDCIADGWNVAMHTNAPVMVDNENVWNNLDPLGPHAVGSTSTQYRTDLQTVKNMIAGD